MKAVFRCDATASIGFGHLSRCIALAEALQMRGVECEIAGHFDPAAAAQISAAGIDRLELANPVNSGGEERTPAQLQSDFLVIDSYRADADYLQKINDLGHSIVVIDDFCKLDTYPCDVVLNFTYEAPKLPYPGGPKLILGHNNLLARRRLVERRLESVERDREGASRRLLVAIGGADPKALALRIVRLLADIDPSLCIHAIAEESLDLASMLELFGPGSQIIPRQPDLSEQLLWADAAITGGGLIKYESAFMGVPAAAIAQNEGQDGETKVFSRAGLVFDLGLADSVSDDELAGRLSTFFSDTRLREGLARQTRASFVPDPSANAAKAILEALKH